MRGKNIFNISAGRRHRFRDNAEILVILRQQETQLVVFRLLARLAKGSHYNQSMRDKNTFNLSAG